MGSVAQDLEVGQNSAPMPSQVQELVPSPSLSTEKLTFLTAIDEGRTYPLAQWKSLKLLVLPTTSFYVIFWFWGYPIVMYDFTNH